MKNKKVLIKLSSEELEQIEKKMLQANIKNRSAYIRKMALDNEIIIFDMKEINEISRLLSITSNNINQVAKACNRYANIDINDIATIMAQLETMRNMFRLFLERVVMS